LLQFAKMATVLPEGQLVVSHAPTSRYTRYSPSMVDFPDGAQDRTGVRGGLARLLAGAGLAVLTLILGLLAKSGPLASADLRVDEHIATHDRTGALTSLFRTVTGLATPEVVGVGLMIVIPVILVLARRRLDAAKVFCMFAEAFALAEI